MSEINLDFLKGKKVLIVDDIADNRLLEALYLQKAGVHVEEACNGIEAVTKALLDDYDAILMDLHMPELDGLGATLRLRQEGYVKPIIAITANGQPKVREVAFDVGVDDYISKPLSNQKLYECLSRLSDQELLSSPTSMPVDGSTGASSRSRSREIQGSTEPGLH